MLAQCGQPYDSLPFDHTLSQSLVICRGAGYEARLSAKDCIMGNTIRAHIDVENKTDFTMEYVGDCFIHNGQIEGTPVSVNPHSKIKFTGRQTGILASGTTGVVAWKIAEHTERPSEEIKFVVLWSAPYNFDHYANYLAIGFRESSYLVNFDSYHDMYYDKLDDPKSKWFTRREFYHDYGKMKIERRCGRFLATGDMGTAHECDVSVVLEDVGETPLNSDTPNN